MPKLEWERVEATWATTGFVVGSTDGLRFMRAKVPGGWLVLRCEKPDSGITFIPDPDHSWT